MTRILAKEAAKATMAIILITISLEDYLLLKEIATGSGLTFSSVSIIIENKEFAGGKRCL